MVVLLFIFSVIGYFGYKYTSEEGYNGLCLTMTRKNDRERDKRRR